MPNHRILFIDAYDSFSNSIISLLRTELAVTVESIKIDDARFVLNDEAFYKYLDGFDAVVAGPGPGHPSIPQDVGLIPKLWTLPEEHCLPVLGICLGFQNLCLSFGAKVERLKEPRHGIVSTVTHCGKDIFSLTGKIVATQYHSLHVNLQRGSGGDGWGTFDLWKPSKHCDQLLPLAWSLTNMANGPILMGVRHESKPFWGVQYHPESICTNKEGQKLVTNWWIEVCAWHTAQKGCLLKGPGLSEPGNDRVDTPTSQLYCEVAGDPVNGRKSTQAAVMDSPCPVAEVHWRSLQASSNVDVAAVTELVRQEGWSSQPLLLESGTRGAKPVNPETGRYSIIGLPDPSSTQLRYTTGSGLLEMDMNGLNVFRKRTAVDQAFSLIDQIISANKACNGPAQVPFWGGFVGFVSYEAGLETIDVSPPTGPEGQPDIWFIFVSKCIVVDHVHNVVYVQTLGTDDDRWGDTAAEVLWNALNTQKLSRPRPSPPVSAQLVDGPEQEAYCVKVRECQSQLRAGESYELCLTNQSTIESSAEPWEIYKQLRARNAAPFSTYLQLTAPGSSSLSVVGSSPERFLSWSRDGKCQFRPIKGTVKKAEGVTRAKAEEVLGSAKERAENLMIVDLIRHDLAGVAGVRDVRVPKLMSIEEYETVFQLVSVIEGDMENKASGSAVLAASLPPGSMTGAPKKRSCELLKEIEGGKPRGLYSGVIGFFDAGGGGDFSVVIRTTYKWGEEGERWQVGAGGAITALSEAQAEWEEMVTKRESVLHSLSR